MIITSDLYQDFGVSDYAQELEQHKKTAELKTLEETISNFILIKSLEDLTLAQRQELDSTQLFSAPDLYQFFSTHIQNYPERLQAYAQSYRELIATS